VAAEPDISVIIPTFNRRGILARTLPTVLDQDLPSARREVIVVVDGSSDGTSELLHAPRFAEVCVMQLPNLGISAARNLGLRTARGGLVLFLDDDMLCEPTLLSGHVAAHNGDDGALIIGGEIKLSAESASRALTEGGTRSSGNARSGIGSG
jgi:glycosyltransferase involved in cell wall biosynthesis